MLLVVLLASLASVGAHAATSAPFQTPRGTARLITDTDSVAPGQPMHVALDITPTPGWHTYWSNPGDAGAATTLAIAAPGASIAPLAFPLPERLPDGPIMSFGYDREVLYTSAITPGSGPLTLTATADWLICKDLCVPEHAVFTLTLPPGSASPSAQAPLIAAALRALPQAAPWPTHIAPDGTLWLRGTPPGPAFFFPGSGDTTDLDAAQTASPHDGLFALHLKPTTSFKPDATMAGVLVFGSGTARIGYRITATPAALPAASATPASGVSLATLLFAFAGGLVLNLMPCVFPVLAMKAVGLAGLGGSARREVRLHAVAYTVGVLVSFLALAGLVLGLRAAGSAAGWGFQFQWPGFVAAALWLFFAIGLNLSGVFEIGGGMMGVGQGLASRGGHFGSFATGLLAVLVATPCTAPFMGVAVAAAASAPPAAAIAVFVALGLGFSLPWTLLAAFPRLAGLMPRPGLWMERLRQVLAFPMYAAAVWMLWVLAAEAGADGVLGAGAGCVLIGLAAWLRRLGAGRFATGGAVLAVVATLALLPTIARAPAAQASSGGIAEADEAFDAGRLQSLRDARKPVLVDMTARWCVTCLVNERVAIVPALPSLKSRGVVYMVGDWTRQDPAIGAFLRQYGRDGVPLYVYFAPGQSGRTLPQILTPDLLRSLS